MNKNMVNGVKSKDAKEESAKKGYPKKQSRGDNYIKVQSTYTTRRSDVTKWYGWGYCDSYFHVDDYTLKFSGNKYQICNRDMIYFKPYIEDKLGVVMPKKMEARSCNIPNDYKYQKSSITEAQKKALTELGLKFSVEGPDRIFRSHGQGNDELMKVIFNETKRIADAVIWPECHEDVVEIVKICNEMNIVIVPYGGGTNVSEALSLPPDEKRTILSLDTMLMNEILWIDEENLVARCESGIIGQDLARELEKVGFTSGHEPDSFEYSTLGGWVSTRASGMKKNTYGNIEDIVVQIRMVTPQGILERTNKVPRLSCGPDFNHIILGSEGNYGVITEVVIKIRPLPPCTKYGSLLFPNFESGVACIREIAKVRCQPANLRLMDNEQFQLSRSLREKPTYFEEITSLFSKFYITNIKGIDLNNLVVATIKYEDEMDVVAYQEAKVKAIAAKYGGISGGTEPGETGYNLTFAIAYIRDITVDFGIATDSFETSVPWDKVLQVVNKTKEVVAEECRKRKIPKHILLSRLSQVYDAGACLHFYFTFYNGCGIRKSTIICDEICAEARDAIIKLGGAVSHHQGVGKMKHRWYKSTVSEVGADLFKACKGKMDPKNIFGVQNLMYESKERI